MTVCDCGMEALGNACYSHCATEQTGERVPVSVPDTENTIAEAKLDLALTALAMIEAGPVGECPGGGEWDLNWAAGVAMGALSSIEEVGYPKPSWEPFGPFTMGLALCDDDGIVRSGRFFKGTEYPCTGHAHFAGEHIECTSPAHTASECTCRPGVSAIVGHAHEHKCALVAVRAVPDTDRHAEALEALERIAEQQQKTLGWIRANGIVFDGPLGTDPSNWQQVAFSIYSDLCEVDTIARSALAVLVSGEGTQ